MPPSSRISPHFFSHTHDCMPHYPADRRPISLLRPLQSKHTGLLAASIVQPGHHTCPHEAWQLLLLRFLHLHQLPSCLVVPRFSSTLGSPSATAQVTCQMLSQVVVPTSGQTLCHDSNCLLVSRFLEFGDPKIIKNYHFPSSIEIHCFRGSA